LQRLNSQDGRTEQLLIQTLGTVSWNAALGASTAVFVQFPRPLLELTEKVSRDYVLPEVPQPSNLEELVEKACQHVDSSVLISKQLEYETIDRRAIQAAKLFASSFVPLSAQDAFGGIRYLRLGKDITLMDGKFGGTYFGPIQGHSPEFDSFLADLVAGRAGMAPFDFTLQDFDRSIFAARYGTFVDLWAVVFVHIGYGIYIILLIRYLFITRPRLILGQSAILFSGFKNGRLCLPNIPIVHRFFDSPSLETAEPVLEYMDARLRDEFSGRAEKRFISFVGTPMVFEVATGLWIVYVPSMHLGHEKYTPVVQHLLHQLLLLTADVNQIAIFLSGTLPPNGAYGSRKDAEALKAAIVKEMEKTGLDVALRETGDELRRYLSPYSALRSLNAFEHDEASFEAHSNFFKETKAKTLANEIVAQGKPNSAVREEQWAAIRDNKIARFCPPGMIGKALQVAANASEVTAGKLDRMAAARASQQVPFDARRLHPSYNITESLLETICHLLDPSSHHKESTSANKDRHSCPGKDAEKILAGSKEAPSQFELSYVLFPIQLLLHSHFGPAVETLLQEDESPFTTLPETFTNPTTKAPVPIFVSNALLPHPLYQPYHQALLKAAQALEKLESDPSTEDVTSAVRGSWETYYKSKEVADWVHDNADSEHAGLASEAEEEDSVASTSTSKKLSIPRRVVSAKGKEREDLGTLTDHNLGIKPPITPSMLLGFTPPSAPPPSRTIALLSHLCCYSRRYSHSFA
ncbi:hypothetical protein BDY24DRAFT_417941, partial [Mrakia frigida]|uniref:uncharacterized protein n=1 Tax=Mrakia frigida TaxID=29902 RepID=UPI003FCC1C19